MCEVLRMSRHASGYVEITDTAIPVVDEWQLEVAKAADKLDKLNKSGKGPKCNYEGGR